jgi:hypothetical protein
MLRRCRAAQVEHEVLARQRARDRAMASYGSRSRGLRRERYRRKDGSLRSSLLMVLLLKG